MEIETKEEAMTELATENEIHDLEKTTKNLDQIENKLQKHLVI